MINLNGWTAANSFFSNENRYSTAKKKISDWVELTEGEEYFLQVNYKEGGGGDHMKTAVEI
jgi:hypothetical protein